MRVLAETWRHRGYRITTSSETGVGTVYLWSGKILVAAVRHDRWIEFSDIDQAFQRRVLSLS